MAPLATMPKIDLSAILPPFGAQWIAGGGKLPKKTKRGYDSSVALGLAIDGVFAAALAAFLGGIRVERASASKAPGVALHPRAPDCVEIGDVTVAGGARTQRFDVVYRPDGPRIAHDSKTLNGESSWGKNFNNMVNDLVAEATTVHHRYPDSVVAFFVLAPEPVLAKGNRLEEASRTLARITGRVDAQVENLHLAEALALAVWDPTTGRVSGSQPDPAAFPMLRVENFASSIESRYKARFRFVPPH